jgi:hypothetical protein
MGIIPKYVSLQQNFMVIDMTLAYNVILGRPFYIKSTLSLVPGIWL